MENRIKKIANTVLTIIASLSAFYVIATKSYLFCFFYLDPFDIFIFMNGAVNAILIILSILFLLYIWNLATPKKGAIGESFAVGMVITIQMFLWFIGALFRDHTDFIRNLLLFDIPNVLSIIITISLIVFFARGKSKK